MFVMEPNTEKNVSKDFLHMLQSEYGFFVLGNIWVKRIILVQTICIGSRSNVE